MAKISPRRQKHGNWPAGGYVPDALTAVKIAEAVLVPVYGEQKIASERPFKAKLDGETGMFGQLTGRFIAQTEKSGCARVVLRRWNCARTMLAYYS